MKIEARGFVTEKRYGDCGYSISRYMVDIVHDIDPHGVQAAISGKIPLTVFTASEGDLLLEKAMVERKVVSVTIEIEGGI